MRPRYTYTCSVCSRVCETLTPRSLVKCGPCRSMGRRKYTRRCAVCQKVTTTTNYVESRIKTCSKECESCNRSSKSIEAWKRRIDVTAY